MTTELQNLRERLDEIEHLIRNELMNLTLICNRCQESRDKMLRGLAGINHDFAGVLSEDRNPPDASELQRNKLVENGGKKQEQGS